MTHPTPQANLNRQVTALLAARRDQRLDASHFDQLQAAYDEMFDDRPWSGGSEAVVDLVRCLLLIDVDVEGDARALLEATPDRYPVRRGVLIHLEEMNEAAAPEVAS
jgi:hypothetical protein